MTRVEPGVDRLALLRGKIPGQRRVGLLCNNATVDREYRGTVEALARQRGLRLVRIFSPQHGFAGEKQDNMIESGDGAHRATGIPLVSLYGRVREPDPAMLDGLDALLVDLPDVGTRVYTFLSTAVLCLQACARAKLPVIVLDRPNPVGGQVVEGPMLRPEFTSFVGLVPVPLRHGLSTGEYCLFAREALGLDVEVSVVRCRGWRRGVLFPGTGLPWIPPSPNLPTFEGALLYPGMVLLEGTNLSEGRGTTRPFEVWGAPWLDAGTVGRLLAPRLRRLGLRLRETAFRPTFHKFQDRTCRGFMLHPVEPDRVRAVAAGLAVLWAVRTAHPDRFAWKEPPYEYDFERPPIDLIAGTDELRLGIEAGTDPAELARSWRGALRSYLERRRPHLLYRS